MCIWSSHSQGLLEILVLILLKFIMIVLKIGPIGECLSHRKKKVITTYSLWCLGIRLFHKFDVLH